MNRIERANDPLESLLVALQSWQSALWTALPAIVQSFNASQMTITAQPAIQARQTAPDGTQSWVTLPLLVDVPVQFPSGGMFVHTFPIKPGDEALIVFSARCIDQWWQTGAVSPQAELRMHDMSDGFAIVGIRSQPRALPGGVSTTSTQLRTVDGECYVEITEDKKVRAQAVDIEAHASHSWSWDVNGFGQRVTYQGANTWNVHTWQRPRIGDTVTFTNSDIAPPEGP